MDDANTIAELRRQLEEQRQLREEAERLQEEAERLQEEAERRLEPNTLLGLLDRCHRSLSQSIQVETNATLTTQGTVMDPVNRLYPKRILPWLDFPGFKKKSGQNSRVPPPLPRVRCFHQISARLCCCQHPEQADLLRGLSPKLPTRYGGELRRNDYRGVEGR